MSNMIYKRPFILCYLILLFILTIKAQFNTQKTTNEYLFGIKKKEDAQLGVENIVNFLIRKLDNESKAVPASEVTLYNYNSSTVQDLKYHVLLCKSVNCRESLDKWDCPTCKRYFPDIEIVRTFRTFPLDITGEILLSRPGASSLTNKLISLMNDLVDVPFIPDGKVHQGASMAVNETLDIINGTVTDLLRLHPSYGVHVIGHSFGGLVASYLATTLFHEIPRITNKNFSVYLFGKPRVGNYEYAQYIKKNNLDFKRIVHLRDFTPHGPFGTSEYVHEGIEYWEFTDKPSRTLKCDGDGETIECSNSLKYITPLDHLLSYGVNVGCF